MYMVFSGISGDGPRVHLDQRELLEIVLTLELHVRGFAALCFSRTHQIKKKIKRGREGGFVKFCSKMNGWGVEYWVRGGGGGGWEIVENVSW